MKTQPESTRLPQDEEVEDEVVVEDEEVEDEEDDMLHPVEMVEKTEVCDLGGHGTIGSDGRLFRNTDEYDTRYAGYTCTNTCRLESQGQKIAPQCFNINNGSISIMK